MSVRHVELRPKSNVDAARTRSLSTVVKEEMLNFAIVVARRKNRAVDINAMKCVAMTGITSAHWSAIAYSTVRSTNVISFVIKAYVNDVWLQTLMSEYANVAQPFNIPL